LFNIVTDLNTSRIFKKKKRERELLRCSLTIRLNGELESKSDRICQRFLERKCNVSIGVKDYLLRRTVHTFVPLNRKQAYEIGTCFHLEA